MKARKYCPTYRYAEALTWSQEPPADFAAFTTLYPLRHLEEFFPRSAHLLMLSPTFPYEQVRSLVHGRGKIELPHAGVLLRNPALSLWLLEDASNGGPLTLAIQHEIRLWNIIPPTPGFTDSRWTVCTSRSWVYGQCPSCQSAEMRALPLYLSAEQF